MAAQTPIAATWVPVINIEDIGMRLIVTADVLGEELKDPDIILKNNGLTARG